MLESDSSARGGGGGEKAAAGLAPKTRSSALADAHRMPRRTRSRTDAHRPGSTHALAHSL
eukprot:3711915-Pleurochrysis_carterae.AAC.1